MEKFSYTVTSEDGITAPKAGDLIKEILNYESVIHLQKDKKIADARIIFNVLGLSVKRNDNVTWVLEGKNEREEAKRLKEYLLRNL